MRRLPIIRLAPRLAILAVGATLPFIAIIVWLIQSGINSSITSAEWEIKGNAFQRPLEHLLDAIPRRYVAVKTYGNNIGAIDTEIDQAFVDLDRVADLLGADLQFTSEGLDARDASRLRTSLVRDRWRTLTTKPLEPEGYDRIVADLQAIMNYAGNTSNLAVDPDLDSAYLIDVTLRALPEMEARLGMILREALEAKETAGTASDSVRKLAVNLADLRTEDLSRIERDVHIMLVEDPNFYGLHVSLHVQLAEEWKQVARATQEFITVLDSSPTVSTEELIRVGNAARSACHRFWNTSAEQSDQLLGIRIRAHRSTRMQVWFATGMMLLLAGVVGWRLGDKIDAEQRAKVFTPAEPGERAAGSSSTNWPTWSTSRPIDRVRFDTLPPQKNE